MKKLETLFDNATDRQDLLWSAIEYAESGIGITNEEGLLYVNPRFLAIFGYDHQDELLGKSPYDLLHPLDRERVINMSNNRFRGQEAPDPYIFKGLKFKGVRRDGSSVPVELSSSRFTFQDQSIIIGYVQDLSEQFERQRRLELAENTISTILESAPAGIIALDLERKVEMWSQGAETILGWQADEVIGQSYPGVPSSRRGEVDALFNRILSGESFHGIETQRYKKSGEVIDVLLSVAPIYAVDQVQGLVGIMVDISKLKKAEQALEVYSKRLETLHALDQSILYAESTSTIAHTAVEMLPQMIDCDRIALSIYDLAQNQGHIAAVYDPKNMTSGEGSTFSLDRLDNFLQLLQNGETCRVNLLDIAQPTSVVQDMVKAGMQTYIAIPLIVQGRLLGSLSLTRESKGRFDPAEEEMLREVATSLAIGIQQAELHRAEQEAQAQMRSLAEYLQIAIEDERTALAREVHDELGQALTALTMDTSWIARRLHRHKLNLHKSNQKHEASIDDPSVYDPIDKRLGMMTELLQQTSRQVQQLAARLRPGLLDDLGLEAALEWQSEEFSQRFGIPVQLRIIDEAHDDRAHDAAHDADELPGDAPRVQAPNPAPNEPEKIEPERATAVFRIFQEALTNIARHAQADRVRVLLKKIDGDLELTISDNGRGIRAKEITARDSFGLMGMQERARSFGGSVHFFNGDGFDYDEFDYDGLEDRVNDKLNENGGGTVVFLRMPIQKHQSKKKP